MRQGTEAGGEEGEEAEREEEEREEEEAGGRLIPTARRHPATLLILTPLTLPFLSRRGEDDHGPFEGEEARSPGSTASSVTSKREEPRAGGGEQEEAGAPSVKSSREEPKAGEKVGQW